MAKGVKVNLHAIDKEVRAVQAKLKAAAAGADEAEQRRIAGLIKKLESVRKSTSLLCPKSWGVFPQGQKATKRTPRKP